MNKCNQANKSDIQTSRYAFKRHERLLFLLVFLIEVVIFLSLILNRRVPAGHDSFQLFAGLYCFLDNAVNCGEIAQWSPFLMHGTPVIWGYIGSTGILQSLFIFSGSLLKGINFLPLFYAEIFFNELILLIGVWLLSRRFFTSAASIFFVTLSVMGSCVWLLQPWSNFLFYYAIPLTLYFLHKFLDSGKWWFFFLAGNLLFMQALGNPPYFLPLASLVIFLYSFTYCLFNFKNVWRTIKTGKFGGLFVVFTLINIFLFCFLYISMKLGANQIVVVSNLRGLDGTVTLDTFLTYGGHLSRRAWLELLLGISPSLDYTLYIGIFSIPLILIGLMFNVNRQNIHFVLIIVVLLLFSMGTSVSILFYYCWPMMKYFRHLMYTAPIIKIFLCFLAGFGFETLFFNGTGRENNRLEKISLHLVPLSLIGLVLFLWFLSYHNKFCADLFRSMVPEYIPFLKPLFNEDLVTLLIYRTTVFALFAYIVFVILSFTKRKKFLFLLLTFLLVAHLADIYSFKISQIVLRTAPINNKASEIIEFQPMPYAKRRDLSFADNNPRAEFLNALRIVYPGSMYWMTHSFLFKDQLGNPFRTKFWLLPLDNYMRAYWGQSIHDLSVKPRGLVPPTEAHPRLIFPENHPAIYKISGVTEDKIQFFSQAEFVSSDDAIVSMITDPDYRGDTIFLSPLADDTQKTVAARTKHTDSDLSANKRLYLPYKVERFDSNNLEVSVDVGALESVWLFYSDVWHPYWRATVNGKRVSVFKANLAYKAVRLEKGVNKVHFYFKSELVSLFYGIVVINAMFWLVMIISLVNKIVLPVFEWRRIKAFNCSSA